jgi:predicted Zn-dependent peptidase
MNDAVCAMKGFNFMTVEKIKIAPGAELSVIPTDKFKSNYLAVNFYFPLEKERASTFSLLSRVMTRGTADHPTIGELNRYTDMLYELNFGVTIGAIGGIQKFTFRMDYLRDRFIPDGEESISDRAMDFLRKFFLRPLVKDGSFSPEYVEAEKKLLIDRIRGEINNKDVYALMNARRKFFGDHPAAISSLGDIEVVSALNGTDLYREYIKMLSDARVEALFVGDVSAGEAEKAAAAIRDALPAERANAEMPAINSPDYDAISTGLREITEDVNAKQGRMVLGYSLPYVGTESSVLNVFLEIFSSSPVSRLFTNVRERLNLCYYCSAIADFSTQSMMIRSGIAEENVESAMEEIARQLSDIAAGNVSESELELAKTAIISTVKSLKDSGASLGEWYVRRIVLGLPSDVDELMRSISDVTVGDVAELAGRARLRMKYFLRGVQEAETEEV